MGTIAEKGFKSGMKKRVGDEKLIIIITNKCNLCSKCIQSVYAENASSRPLRLTLTVCAPVCRSSVRPSVCLSVRLSVSSGRRSTPLWDRCCGPGDQKISIDCCTAGGQQQLRRSTARSSKCGECHAVSWRRKLNTDLFE